MRLGTSSTGSNTTFRGYREMAETEGCITRMPATAWLLVKLLNSDELNKSLPL
jgi:hypothetical protein